MILLNAFKFTLNHDCVNKSKMNITKFLLITLVVSSAVAYRKVAYTASNLKCMSECVPGSFGRMFCWTGWGRNSWEGCTETNDIANRYLTSGSKNPELKYCTSECMNVDNNNKYWCFTGEDGIWDRCSPSKGVAYTGETCVKDCKLDDENYYYTCQTTDNWLLSNSFQYCSPAPYHPPTVSKQIKSLNNRCTVTSRKINEYSQCFEVKKMMKNSNMKKRSLDDRSCYDVREIVNGYENALPVQRIAERGRAPIDYTSFMTSGGVEVLLTMRATLRPATTPATTAGRQYPNGNVQRMQELNKLDDDDIGHMLALSLGGPENALINLVPQHRTTNRNVRTSRDSTAFSYWRRVETDLVSMLRNDNTVDHIDWVFVAMYEGDLEVLDNRRPVSFGLHYTIYYNNHKPMYESGNCLFDNEESGDPI